MKKILFYFFLFFGLQVFGTAEESDLPNFDCTELEGSVETTTEERDKAWNTYLSAEEEKYLKFDVFLVILTNGLSTVEAKTAYFMYSDRIVRTNERIREGLVTLPELLSVSDARKAYEAAELVYYKAGQRLQEVEDRFNQAKDDLEQCNKWGIPSDEIND